MSTPRNIRKLACSILEDVDVLHCHEFRTVENLQVIPFASKSGIPVILSPHGTVTYSTGRGRFKLLWDHFLSPTIAQHIDRVVALTVQEGDEIQAVWGQIEKRNPATRFEVVPNGIDLDMFDALPDAKSFRAKYNLGNYPVVLFVGRLHARKGVDILVKAFQQMPLDTARLLIVGPDEGMRNMIRAIADERIILTGHLDDQNLLGAYAAADLFVLPAVGEGLSMAVLEAMGVGLPVILSPGCNMPEVAEEGAGMIVEAQVSGLAYAMQGLLEDGDKRVAMGAAARRLVETRYTWDRVAEQYEIIYQGLVDTAS